MCGSTLRSSHFKRTRFIAVNVYGKLEDLHSLPSEWKPGRHANFSHVEYFARAVAALSSFASLSLQSFH